MSIPIVPFDQGPVLPPGVSVRPQAAQGGPAKLGSTAKEFESILLTQWLQAAQESFATVPGADDGQDAGDEQMKSFGVQQLAKSLSDAGGIGIARLVTHALRRESSPAGEEHPTNHHSVSR